MRKKLDQNQITDIEASRQRRLVAMHLQEMAGNPLDAEDVAMFEMFEREGRSHKRRLACIRERALAAAFGPAAEQATGISARSPITS